ncbi:MAG: putative IMPACT (imprinted ancient) family translation regulator [Roseivirga sp.]|jgi:putative IMPACT (imprinted ancient) family translation regulator
MFPYEEMNEVQRLAKELDLEVVDQTFEMACSMKVNVLLSKVETFESKVQLLQDLSHNIQLK